MREWQDASGNLLVGYARAESTFVSALTGDHQAYGTRPYTPRSYAAFRARNDGRTDLLRIDGSPTSLADALANVLPLCIFKDKVAVRETDDDGSRLHLFTIRKKAPQWVHPAGEIMPRRVEDLYADPVCVLDMTIINQPAVRRMAKQIREQGE